jgi:hypothetical protein
MRRYALGTFVACVFLAYGVFFTGAIVSGDNIVQYHQTIQIADHHRVSFSTADVAAILQTYDWGLNTRFGVNADRTTFTQVHGIGQPVLSLPLFLALRSVRHAVALARPTDMTLWCLNWPVFTVLCVMLTLGTCRLAGVTGVGWTTLITFAAAFSSPIWTYSSVPYNVVGEVLVIAAAIDLCLLFDSGRLAERGTRYPAAATLAALLIFGVTIRPFFASAIPAFMGWFLYSVQRSTVPTGKKWGAVAAFTLVFMAGCSAVAAFNVHYFGSPLSSAYHDLGRVMNFDGPWLVGFTGTFLSPLKSPLYFFPVVALLPVALSVLVWRKEPVAWFAVLFLLPQAYLIPKYSLWDGGPDLFARFWFRIVPIVFLSLAAAVARTRARTLANAGLLVATVSLAALGLRAQLLTVMTDERQVYARVVAELDGQHPGGNELVYHESIPNLLGGRTLVSMIQLSEMNAPRSFLLFRSISNPRQRLWAAVAALLGSALSLALFCHSAPPVRLPARGSRGLEAAKRSRSGTMPC